MRDAVRLDDDPGRQAGRARPRTGGAVSRYEPLGGEAEAQLERHDPYNVMVYVRTAQVGLGFFTGDYPGTTSPPARLHTTIDEHEPIPFSDWHSSAPNAGRLAGQPRRGRPPAARRLRALHRRDASLAPHFAYHAHRSGAPAAPMRQAMAARCQSRLASASAPHAAARTARTEAMMAACDEMADIGAFRYAVENASEAATIFVNAGRAGSARRAAARSREPHVPGQGAELLAIDGPNSAAGELTPRESQLIDWASQGLSNAEIPDRLVISVRTVETHIHRGMHKLGISDRRELVFRPPGTNADHEQVGRRRS
jgi:DNA-binding NarL/FixJ family response regulator